MAEDTIFNDVDRKSEVEMLKAIDKYATAQNGQYTAYNRLALFLEKRVRENMRKAFQPGDKIKFTTRGSNSEVIYGKVVKANKKSIGIVQCSRNWSTWNVSPQLLEKVSDEEYAKIEAEEEYRVGKEMDYIPTKFGENK